MSLSSEVSYLWSDLTGSVSLINEVSYLCSELTGAS